MSNQQRAFAALNRLSSLPLETLRKDVVNILGLYGKGWLHPQTHISRLRKADLIAEITLFVRRNINNLDRRGPLHWGYKSRAKRFVNFVEQFPPHWCVKPRQGANAQR